MAKNPNRMQCTCCPKSFQSYRDLDAHCLKYHNAPLSILQPKATVQIMDIMEGQRKFKPGPPTPLCKSCNIHLERVQGSQDDYWCRQCGRIYSTEALPDG